MFKPAHHFRDPFGNGGFIYSSDNVIPTDSRYGPLLYRWRITVHPESLLLR
jgi:hypothetical protein